MRRNYMMALYQRFETPSERASILQRAIKNVHKQLSSQLTKPQRKLLLRLVDLEDALQDQCCLDSFFAGFRLASGIHRELEEVPPYNFVAEEEQRARKLAEDAREEG